jgi:hypothetical protein
MVNQLHLHMMHHAFRGSHALDKHIISEKLTLSYVHDLPQQHQKNKFNSNSKGGVTKILDNQASFITDQLMNHINFQSGQCQ